MTGENDMFRTPTLKDGGIVEFEGNEKGKIISIDSIQMFVIFPFGTIHS